MIRCITCKKKIRKAKEYIMRVKREVGEEWCRIFAIYLLMFFRGEEPKCENCINFIERKCEGGGEPFECFFQKSKKSKGRRVKTE